MGTRTTLTAWCVRWVMIDPRKLIAWDRPAGEIIADANRTTVLLSLQVRGDFTSSAPQADKPAWNAPATTSGYAIRYRLWSEHRRRVPLRRCQGQLFSPYLSFFLSQADGYSISNERPRSGAYCALLFPTNRRPLRPFRQFLPVSSSATAFSLVPSYLAPHPTTSSVSAARPNSQPTAKFAKQV